MNFNAISISAALGFANLKVDAIVNLSALSQLGDRDARGFAKGHASGNWVAEGLIKHQCTAMLCTHQAFFIVKGGHATKVEHASGIFHIQRSMHVLKTAETWISAALFQRGATKEKMQAIVMEMVAAAQHAAAEEEVNRLRTSAELKLVLEDWWELTREGGSHRVHILAHSCNFLHVHVLCGR